MVRTKDSHRLPVDDGRDGNREHFFAAVLAIVETSNQTGLSSIALCHPKQKPKMEKLSLASAALETI